MAMKLSVSNIAWEQNKLEEHLGLLKRLECDGVEIAPSCIWREPIGVGKEEVENFKRVVSKYGLAISAFHALLFTKPDLYLFGDKSTRQQAVLYLKRLIQLAGILSVPVLVYGSPASRKIGNKSYETCYQIAVEVLRKLGKEAALHDTFFCIEPLGSTDGDFIQTADEAYKLIRDVGEPNFGLHLDTKAMIEMKEDFTIVFRKYASMLQHFHISEPGLAPPGYSGFDHSIIGKGLAKTTYNRFISIEMRRGFGESKEVIKNAVKYVSEKYLLGIVK